MANAIYTVLNTHTATINELIARVVHLESGGGGGGGSSSKAIHVSAAPAPTAVAMVPTAAAYEKRIDELMLKVASLEQSMASLAGVKDTIRGVGDDVRNVKANMFQQKEDSSKDRGLLETTIMYKTEQYVNKSIKQRIESFVDRVTVLSLVDAAVTTALDNYIPEQATAPAPVSSAPIDELTRDVIQSALDGSDPFQVDLGMATRKISRPIKKK